MTVSELGYGLDLTSLILIKPVCVKSFPASVLVLRSYKQHWNAGSIFAVLHNRLCVFTLSLPEDLS